MGWTVGDVKGTIELAINVPKWEQQLITCCEVTEADANDGDEPSSGSTELLDYQSLDALDMLGTLHTIDGVMELTLIRRVREHADLLLQIENGDDLRDAPPHVWSDRAFVLAALRVDG